MNFSLFNQYFDQSARPQIDIKTEPNLFGAFNCNKRAVVKCPSINSAKHASPYLQGRREVLSRPLDLRQGEFHS